MSTITPEARERSNFMRELTSLLNRYSKEEASDTPDFLISEYLLMCLAAYEKTITNRRIWWGSGDKDRAAARQTGEGQDAKSEAGQ